MNPKLETLPPRKNELLRGAAPSSAATSASEHSATDDPLRTGTGKGSLVEAPRHEVMSLGDQKISCPSWEGDTSAYDPLCG
jgi:hypothetical protein